MTPEQRIFTILADVPAGKVVAYGQLARMAGLPGRARWVGRLMGQLPQDSTLPWHRVMKSSGDLAFSEQDPRFQKQQRLLENEGIQVISGKVAQHYFWQPA